MTNREIREKSKEQLSDRRFRAIGSLAALVTVKLFFVLLRLTSADFLLSNKIIGGLSLVVSSEKTLILTRIVLFFAELLLTSVVFSSMLCVYCQPCRKAPLKNCINLIALRLLVTLFKLPYLICAFISLKFFNVIFFEYNARTAEFAIAVLMLLCALCFLLIYLHSLVGLFVAPLLIANGERAFTAALRSLNIMKKNRARLLRFLLSCLPEALLIFTLPQIAMRFVVFAGECAHLYSDDI